LVLFAPPYDFAYLIGFGAASDSLKH